MGKVNASLLRCIPVCRDVRLNGEYADSSSEEDALPQEARSTPSKYWGDRLVRSMQDKYSGFISAHSWRETLIDNVSNLLIPP